VPSYVIGYTVIAIMISGFIAGISECIRNHFLPNLIAQLPDASEQQIDQKSLYNIKSISMSVWGTMILFVVLLVLAGRPIINLYGESFVPGYYIMLLIITSMFFTNTWSLSRAILVHFPRCNSALSYIQWSRLVLGTISLIVVVWLTKSPFGMVLSVAIPSLLATIMQLVVLFKKSGLNLVFPA
jgi:hypothetical protein